jgi:hypothetical protein
VPNPENPQGFNRYSYAINNPLKYTDPTGHAYDARGASSPISCSSGTAPLHSCIYPENYPDASKRGYLIPDPTYLAEVERNRHIAASGAGMIPYLDTGEDALTFFTGCGYACRAGYEDPVGWGWRTVAGVGLIAPFGVSSVRSAVNFASETLEGTAIVKAYRATLGNRLPHFTIEVHYRGQVLETEQLVLSRNDLSRTTIDEVISSASPHQTAIVPLPNAREAQSYQRAMIGQELGPYGLNNSCITHVCNVLRVSGVPDVPSGGSGIRDISYVRRQLGLDDVFRGR